MPIVEAHILQGYDAGEKRRLTGALTDAIRFVVPAPDEAITVMLHEYPAESYARGGITRDPAPALPDPAALVLDYLGAMQARELTQAQAMLAFHANGAAVVYTRGTLAGAWPDGAAFSGIRFIDRFEVTGGKITRQDVWNDIAEVRPA